MTFPAQCELVGGPFCGSVVAWPPVTHARLRQGGTNRLVVYRLEEGVTKAVCNPGTGGGIGSALWVGSAQEVVP